LGCEDTCRGKAVTAENNINSKKKKKKKKGRGSKAEAEAAAKAKAKGETKPDSAKGGTVAADSGFREGGGWYMYVG